MHPILVSGRPTSSGGRDGRPHHRGASSDGDRVLSPRSGSVTASHTVLSPGAAEAIRLIASEIRNSTLCSLARATEGDIDAAAKALEPARRKRLHIFIATSRIHREAMGWLRAVPREEPFFLYLASTVPHANNEAGSDGMEVPDVGVYGDRPWPERQRQHAAMVSTRLPSAFGSCIEYLLVSLRIGLQCCKYICSYTNVLSQSQTCR